MMPSLNTAVSGMQQFQQQINVIGNNIANVNTAGFKDARANFEDTFSQALGTDSQVGSGVTTSAVQNLFTQGSLASTGVSSDLAISGPGFFVVRDASTATATSYVTRAGNFKVDAGGYLVTQDGMRVQGFSDSALTAPGDIMIDATGAPSTAAAGATAQSFSVGNDGRITVTLNDGTSFVRGQVLLQNFRDPSALVKQGSNLYSAPAAAGPLAAMSAPNTNGLGKIQGAALEMSNVDLTTEMSSLISAQRAFQANARIISTSDEVLQVLVNLTR